MFKKLIVFAITSGLAAKLVKRYMAKRQARASASGASGGSPGSASAGTAAPRYPRRAD